MAGVSVKMGVDVSQFKQGLQEAQSSVKTLDAALKMNEKQLKATGDAEIYAANKVQLLNKQMDAQRKVVSNIQKQMDAMKKNGVEETSEAYQKLERSLYNAVGKMQDIQTELNGLANSEQNAAKGANEVATNIASINKKVSFDAVIKGIDSITGAMEKAAKTAINLGKNIWDNITDSAEWADATATMATKLGMDVEDYQRYQKVFDTYADITVKDWQKAKNKVQQAVYNTTDEQMDIFAALGVGIRKKGDPRYNRYTSMKEREWEDVFWEIGEKLQENVANHKITQDQADVYAQAIFGKSYSDLLPILKLGQEGFTQALEEQNVVSEESINKMAQLNDELIKLKSDFRDLQTEVLAGLAPALESAAKVLDSLLTRLMEYLQSPEGQAALDKMGDAVSEMFSDLSKIDPEQVVSGVVEVFEKITGAFTWISENWEGVMIGLEAITGVFVAFKAGSGLLKMVELVNGLKNLGGAKGVQDAVNAVNGSGGGGTGTTAGGCLLGWMKTGIAKIGEGLAANGLWAFTPAAVFSLAIAPALKLQSDIETQTVDAYEAANEILDAAEEAGDTSKELITLARQANEATMPNGYDKNFLGQINFGYNSKIDDAVKMFGLRQYDAMWKDLFAKYYQYDNVNGWSIGALTRLARGEGVKDAYGVTTYGIDQQTSDALATAMRDVLTQAIANGYSYDPYKWSRTTIQRRELPNGWAYDESGNIRRVDASGNFGNYLESYGEAGHGGTTYWDDRQWQQWRDAENAKYAEESASAITEAAATMSTLPEMTAAAVAAAVSQVTLQVDISGLYGKKHANGIWGVPWDGYPAILHRGERVLSARDAATYNANSNLYVEHMHMGGGMDAQALAAAMAAQNRRISAGFGS